MIAIPMELKDAQAYINQYHRHHQAAHRDKFRIAASDGDIILGVIQVGRPVNAWKRWRSRERRKLKAHGVLVAENILQADIWIKNITAFIVVRN